MGYLLDKLTQANGEIVGIVKSLGMDKSVYPIINKVVVARNFNSNIAKRLLFDFLDIYSEEFFKCLERNNINFQNNIYEFEDSSSGTKKKYYIDIFSSGIFSKIPNNDNKKTGEDIEEFARVIQTLCENVPINIDVRGLFSGIDNSSTFQQKALCKMRLASMILGKNFELKPNPELTYYQFNPNSSVEDKERIVCWGYGTCKPDDGTKNIYTEEFNFKITKYDTDSSGTNMYIVSVSSAITGNSITLLPLPDYFIRDIGSADISTGVVTNCLASPNHCIGFSRNGVYNVKFVITQGQYGAFKNNKTNEPVKFMCDSGNDFTFTPALTSPTNRSGSDPFPNVLWYISGKSVSSGSSAPARSDPTSPSKGKGSRDAAAAAAAAAAADENNPQNWEIRCQNDDKGVSTPVFVHKSTKKSEKMKPKCINAIYMYNLIKDAEGYLKIPAHWTIGYSDTKGLYFEDSNNKKYETCTDTFTALDAEKDAAASKKAAAAKAQWTPGRSYITLETQKRATEAAAAAERDRLARAATAAAERYKKEEEGRAIVERLTQDLRQREEADQRGQRIAAAAAQRAAAAQAERARQAAERDRQAAAAQAEIDRQAAQAEKDRQAAKIITELPTASIQASQDNPSSEAVEALKARIGNTLQTKKILSEQAAAAAKSVRSRAATTANLRSRFMMQLPEGWEEIKNKSGENIYRNTRDGSTQENFPTVPAGKIANKRAQPGSATQPGSAIEPENPLSFNAFNQKQAATEAAAALAPAAAVTGPDPFVKQVRPKFIQAPVAQPITSIQETLLPSLPDLQPPAPAPAAAAAAVAAPAKAPAPAKASRQPKQLTIQQKFEQELQSKVAGRKFYLNPDFGKSTNGAIEPTMRYVNGLGEYVNEIPAGAAEPTQIIEPIFVGGNKANKKHRPNNKNKNKNNKKKVSVKKNKKHAPTKKTRRNKRNKNKK